MKTLYTLIFFAICQTLLAQGHDGHVTSDNHKNEIAIANSSIYIIRKRICVWFACTLYQEF